MLAVSKRHPSSNIRQLHQEGQLLFGENYVQEAKQKQLELSALQLQWHLIGSLQKNKAKEVIGLFDLIHSIDSLALAEALNKRLESAGKKQKILIQLNLADETSKGGFSLSEFEKNLAALQALEHLEISGLMTMPPLAEDPESSRPYFKKLRSLRDELQKSAVSIRELSMGTSSDYLVAADEGATLVRLGTVLFGART
ncbi:MAG: YggS family pyridoxal phosphate-dependent enzyme [Bdellovibrio sp.]